MEVMSLTWLGRAICKPARGLRWSTMTVNLKLCISYNSSNLVSFIYLSRLNPDKEFLLIILLLNDRPFHKIIRNS